MNISAIINHERTVTVTQSVSITSDFTTFEAAIVLRDMYFQSRPQLQPRTPQIPQTTFE